VTKRTARRRAGQVLGAGLLLGLALLGPGQVVAVGAATGTISGRVTDPDGAGVGGLHVVIAALDKTATTATNGTYSLGSVPVTSGRYDVQLLAPCHRDQTRRVAVDGAETVDFTVGPPAVQSGYLCRQTSASYIDTTAGQVLAIPGNGDDETICVTAPFEVRLFADRTTQPCITTNGTITSPTGPSFQPGNTAFPNSEFPVGVIAPFWDDFVIDGSAQIRRIDGGSSPNRFMAVEWRNARFFQAPFIRITFEAVIFESGRIVFHYAGPTEVVTTLSRGTSATVGLQDFDGSTGIQRSFNQGLLDTGLSIEFVPSK
jgi:hypothetical protein